VAVVVDWGVFDAVEEVEAEDWEEEDGAAVDPPTRTA